MENEYTIDRLINIGMVGRIKINSLINEYLVTSIHYCILYRVIHRYGNGLLIHR